MFASPGVYHNAEILEGQTEPWHLFAPLHKRGKLEEASQWIPARFPIFSFQAAPARHACVRLALSGCLQPVLHAVESFSKWQVSSVWENSVGAAR